MNQNSGGHRYGSNQFLSDYYTPEAYNGGLLDEVGNKLKKPPIEAALASTPLKDAMTTGLLSESNGGAYERSGGNYDFSSRTGDAEKTGATSPASAASSPFGGGPLGGLLGGSGLSLSTQSSIGEGLKQAAIGFGTGGVLGSLIGGAKGLFSGYTSEEARQMAAYSAREAAQMQAAAQAQREADAIAAQQALAAAQASSFGGGLRSTGSGGYSSPGGNFGGYGGVSSGSGSGGTGSAHFG